MSMSEWRQRVEKPLWNHKKRCVVFTSYIHVPFHAFMYIGASNTHVSTSMIVHVGNSHFQGLFLVHKVMQRISVWVPNKPVHYQGNLDKIVVTCRRSQLHHIDFTPIAVL